MGTPSTGDTPESFQPVAAILACALPGAGQWYLGYRARGVCAAIGVLGLFFGGLLIGGLNCVDSRENRVWFIGQALTGPVAFITDGVHQRYFKGSSPTGANAGRAVTPGPDETIVTDSSGQRRLARITDGSAPPIVRSFGRPNELGVLFGAIAGMLNLICVIDAAWSRAARPAGRAGAPA
ncbi:MAG: DUF6677 family protein [Phycisphaerales bacterium]